MENIELRNSWIDLPIDELNNNHLLINNVLVMADDENEIMKDMAEIVGTHGGIVVETGFGMGISAKMIDSYEKVHTHIIVEANKNVYHNLVKYAESITDVNVKPFSFFEDWITSQPSNFCDGLFFDTYPIILEDEYNYDWTFRNFKEIYRILKPGGVFTFFGEWIMSDLSLHHLLKAGFKRDDIHFKKKLYNICKEDEYLETKNINNTHNAVFNICKIVKSKEDDIIDFYL